MIAQVKTLLKLALFIAVFSWSGHFCRKKTDGFTIGKISSTLAPNPAWNVSEPNLDEIKPVLNQKFHYLARGAQSYVFASEDGKYVLKFFSHHHMRAPLWLKMLPFEKMQLRAQKLNAKLGKDFSSYKIAYEELKDETGLVYLHLNKTSTLNSTIHIVDKLGIEHTLPADGMEFLIQKKADLLYPALDYLAQSGKADEAKALITELVQLLERRCRKGIFDKDPDLNTNFGVLEGHPIQIDIGRFKRNSVALKTEVVRITDNLHQYLMLRYPELDEHLRGELNQLNET